MNILSYFTRRKDNRAGELNREAIHLAEVAAIERDLDQRLAIRKASRSDKTCAALKGWQTRRAS